MVNIYPIFLFLTVLIVLLFFVYVDEIKRIFRILIFPTSADGKYVKICPKCGSAKVQVDFSNPVVWAYGTVVKYKCKSCMHLGTLFPEVLVEDMEKYRKELKAQIKQGKLRFKKEDLFDASTGFYAGIWEVIIGLFLLPVFLTLLIIYFVKGSYNLNIFFEENSGMIMTSLLGTIFLVYLVSKTIKYIQKK